MNKKYTLDTELLITLIVNFIINNHAISTREDAGKLADYSVKELLKLEHKPSTDELRDEIFDRLVKNIK